MCAFLLPLCSRAERKARHDEIRKKYGELSALPIPYQLLKISSWLKFYRSVVATSSQIGFRSKPD